MFKRVAKRERKREREEELGLDAETKQILGLQDTDSDESLNSDSDSESDDHSDIDSGTDEEIDGEDADLTGNLLHERKHPGHRLGALSDSAGTHGESHSESEQSDATSEGDAEADDEYGPPMSVMAAITDPIYDIPGAPATQDLRACIVCPGKIIKNSMMAKTHLESNAHRRRLQRYTVEVSKRTSSAEGLNTDDPRDILRDMAGTVIGAQADTSNRSQRRAQWKNKMRSRNKSQKERKKLAAEASKNVDHETGDGGETVKKVEKRVKRRAANVPALVAGLDAPEPSKVANGRSSQTTKSGPVEETGGGEHVRPKKRQKRGAAVDMNISSLSEAHSVSEPSHTKVRSGGPPLKQNSTSFYFADDERVQPSSAASAAQSKRPQKYRDVVDEVQAGKPTKQKRKLASSQSRYFDNTEGSSDRRSGSQAQDAVDGVKKSRSKAKSHGRDNRSQQGPSDTKKKGKRDGSRQQGKSSTLKIFN